MLPDPNETPLTPEEIEALERARRAEASEDPLRAGDGLPLADELTDRYPGLADRLRQDAEATTLLGRTVAAAQEAFDPERARYAVTQRLHADRFMLLMQATFGGLTIAVVAAHAWLWPTSQEEGWNRVLFVAGAMALGVAVRALVMLKRRRWAARMNERGPLNLEAIFTRMRHSSRNEQVLLQACLWIGMLAGALMAADALVTGRWLNVLAGVFLIALMAWTLARRAPQRDEAFFAGNLSFREWLQGAARRDRKGSGS